MMAMIWVLLVALAGPQLGHGFPVGPTSQAYPHDGSTQEGWTWEGVAYAALPALALAVTAIGLLLGCTWCYRHKDCKPDQGTDNQLFSASSSQLQEARRSQPPDSGFSEPANNNISEDNNNGPISLREMQNIANNNAAAYITSENEERNRVSRESVVEFEPLPAPAAIRVPDPLERCAHWFGGEDFPRERLQYLREFARGWFGRVVEAEMEVDGVTTTAAVKILNQNATLEDKARFLTEAQVYRDLEHENLLRYLGKGLQEDPWVLIFDMCSMDLRQYLISNRPKMAALNEEGVPLQLMCDVTAALAYLHNRGCHNAIGPLCSDNVLVTSSPPRAVLGSYAPPATDHAAPETRRHPPLLSASSEVWSLGVVVWEVCAWGEALPPAAPPPPPDAQCLYRDHLYQVMQMCWNPDPALRPTASQVHALLSHLQSSHARAAPADFEDRWQRLKPNTIPKLDEHVALVHAPSTSAVPDRDYSTTDTLSVDLAVSRSSSIMSDRDPLAAAKSESLTNLHGSLDDVRNIYLTHNETPTLECHQGNIGYEENSDSLADPWLKDIIADSQDDVSYYKDVIDVINNLDNMLNSEKTSSSESSHQASPSRDNLSLDCKKDYQVQSSLVKSPGISNFQNVLEMGFDSAENEPLEDDEADRDTIGTLSHSFERHSDTMSQHTLENMTPDTPMNDFVPQFESLIETVNTDVLHDKKSTDELESSQKLPNESKVERSDNVPALKDLCVASMPSVSENEQLNVREDCNTSCDNNLAEIVRTDKEVETKSIGNSTNDVDTNINTNVREVESADTIEMLDECVVESVCNVESSNLPKLVNEDSAKQLEEIPIHNANSNISLHEEEMSSPKTEIGEEKEPQTHVHEVVESSAKKEIAKEPKTHVIKETVNEHTSPTNLSTSINSSPKKDTDSLEIRSEETSDDKHIEAEGINEDIEELAVKAVDTITETPSESVSITEVKPEKKEFSECLTQSEESCSLDSHTPELVQNSFGKDTGIESTHVLYIETDKSDNITTDNIEVTFDPILPPEEVQNIITETGFISEESAEKSLNDVNLQYEEANAMDRSEISKLGEEQHSNESTVYMDLINDTNSEVVKAKPVDNNVRDFTISYLDNSSDVMEYSSYKNESTVYLDLPSILKKTDDFLHSERVNSANNMKESEQICASTPKSSDISADNTLECSVKDNGDELSKTKTPYCAALKEYKPVTDSLSPCESPTKSHHTDTYDENSSVVLGPFENCATELFKIKEVDIPKEELLAFSSNFSEINLETPSPLRDGNFLNEVPDIPDIALDDSLNVTSEAKKPEVIEAVTDNTDETDESGTAKRLSPSTPPNSPGIFLASTSQQKYVVDIELEPPAPAFPVDSDSGMSSLQKELDMNQIELTAKLAMAENENNMNIEYSGPLTVEGVVSEDDVILVESDSLPESYLAGNGGATDNELFTMDEECMKALRNELELKLPLAQVAAIEPALEVETECVEGLVEWVSLPPPPDLVVSYCGGALSPIQEETGTQLRAYDNDAWTTTSRTESSESYPEPCNLSADEVTDLPDTRHTHTYTLHSQNDTYTIQKDIPSEMTMSADSLNGSPYKKPIVQSPIDDKTYIKDEKEACERISQVSPFLLSPTEASVPQDSDNIDHATAQSTLSKTTLPTDAKHSKPSECLSKATSIDSWCSNDTLYNVEENFDDLAIETDVYDTQEKEDKEDKSDSTDTLTHHDEKDISHCSTYIIHDSKSDADTFSPDSINEKDNNTYTKPQTDVTEKPEINDSNNTQIIETQGILPTYSNCSTEHISAMGDWKLPQPEMVRRSPVAEEMQFTPPKIPDLKDTFDMESPKTVQPVPHRMDSVEISCLVDDSASQNKSDNVNQEVLTEVYDSPKYNMNMAPSVTSTPILDAENNMAANIETVSDNDSPESLLNLPNFQMFLQSVELRPQDITPNSSEHVSSNTDLLLEGESKLFSKNSNRDSLAVSERTPNYSDFEHSANNRPQDINSTEKSSQNSESGVSSGDFRHFESSVRSRPQDLTSLIDATSLLLKSEIQSSENAMSAINANSEQTSQSISRVNDNDLPSSVNPPNTSESQEVFPYQPINIYVTDIDVEDENEQPHSIIITEMSKELSMSPRSYDSHTTLPKVNTINETSVTKGSPNKTYDSHVENDYSLSYDSHADIGATNNANEDTEKTLSMKINGVNDDVIIENLEVTETKVPVLESETDEIQNLENGIPNGSTSEDISSKETVKEVKCNGNSEKFATVSFLVEPFEELIESNVDGDKDAKSVENNEPSQGSVKVESPNKTAVKEEISEMNKETKVNGNIEGEIVSMTEDFLRNEKSYCQLDTYLPLLNDIRFTGPAADVMSTSFTQDSPTEPSPPECERDGNTDAATDILKDWDSDTESQSSNSSSGEFIWKQRGGNGSGGAEAPEGEASGSGDSGSGSEGDEVEFVPSSWDCLAAPSKSSLRSLEQVPSESKKRVVFKRQKYHCVYEYPREAPDVDHSPPAYLPDLSTYCEWDPRSAEEAELGYGQLFGAGPLDLYPLRAGVGYGADFDDDFFISSSARPFESLGVMSSSQFFPGMHVKPRLDDVSDPPSPLALALPRTAPSLDFTTPDSGVEDITPSTTNEEEKKLPESEVSYWRPVDSGSSSESVSPSSPGGEALGGLRHTRDKLKLDLPPSPHLPSPSPRHNRVFNFVLDKPKRRHVDTETVTPLVMTDQTPVITNTLPLEKDEEVPVPEPTFSTFGKTCSKVEDNEQKIILDTDDVEEDAEKESVKVEAVKGEGTVLDSGDEDSGIESSSKATLERNKTPNMS